MAHEIGALCDDVSWNLRLLHDASPELTDTGTSTALFLLSLSAGRLSCLALVPTWETSEVCRLSWLDWVDCELCPSPLGWCPGCFFARGCQFSVWEPLDLGLEPSSLSYLS